LKYYLIYKIYKIMYNSVLNWSITLLQALEYPNPLAKKLTCLSLKNIITLNKIYYRKTTKYKQAGILGLFFKAWTNINFSKSKVDKKKWHVSVLRLSSFSISNTSDKICNLLCCMYLHLKAFLTTAPIKHHHPS